MKTSVKVASLIHKPSSAVYNAIIDPEKMNQYFISYADHVMEEGKKITWQFSDVGAELKIEVKKLIPGSLIVFSWEATGETTVVEISLEPCGESSTSVQIREHEWKINEPGVSKALQQTEGWTDFLCSLKAYLLFDVNLRLGRKTGK